MAEIGHNGGPAPIDVDVPDMAYVKFFPGDFLNGTAHLSLEMVGAYIRTLCVMYDRMGGFPFDEREGGVLLRVDKRVYRRVRDHLLADGKFYRDGDMIRNARVEKEIASYVTEYIRRSEAAKKREAERRAKETSAELRPNLSGTSAVSSPEVQEKLVELEQKNPTKTTKREAQDNHIPESRSQNPEARIKKDKEKEVHQGLTAPAAIAAPPNVDAHQAFEDWNALALRCGLQQARSLTPQRRQKLVARIREHGGMAAWARALANVERSSFLRGSNDRGWRADFDFLLQPASFAKVHDGTYGNGAHAPQPPKNNIREMARRAAEGKPMRVDEPEGDFLEIEWSQVQ